MQPAPIERPLNLATDAAAYISLLEQQLNDSRQAMVHLASSVNTLMQIAHPPAAIVPPADPAAAKQHYKGVHYKVLCESCDELALIPKDSIFKYPPSMFTFICTLCNMNNTRNTSFNDALTNKYISEVKIK